MLFTLCGCAQALATGLLRPALRCSGWSSSCDFHEHEPMLPLPGILESHVQQVASRSGVHRPKHHFVSDVVRLALQALVTAFWLARSVPLLPPCLWTWIVIDFDRHFCHVRRGSTAYEKQFPRFEYRWHVATLCHPRSSVKDCQQAWAIWPFVLCPGNLLISYRMLLLSLPIQNSGFLAKAKVYVRQLALMLHMHHVCRDEMRKKYKVGVCSQHERLKESSFDRDGAQPLVEISHPELPSKVLLARTDVEEIVNQYWSRTCEQSLMFHCASGLRDPVSITLVQRQRATTRDQWPVGSILGL